MLVQIHCNQYGLLFNETFIHRPSQGIERLVELMITIESGKTYIP